MDYLCSWKNHLWMVLQGWSKAVPCFSQCDTPAFPAWCVARIGSLLSSWYGISPHERAGEAENLGPRFICCTCLESSLFTKIWGMRNVDFLFFLTNNYREWVSLVFIATSTRNEASIRLNWCVGEGKEWWAMTQVSQTFPLSRFSRFSSRLFIKLLYFQKL